MKKQKIYGSTHPFVLLTILFLLALGGLVFGQTTAPQEDCKNKDKTAAKAKPAKTPPVRMPAPRVKPVIINGKEFDFRFRRTVRPKIFDEKSIAVHPKVYVSLCVVQGSIKVNGWSRSEARVFINGSKRNQIGFKVRERERTEKKPVWIQVLGYNPETTAENPNNICLSGEIELDVPLNASITIENSKGESETTIDSVRAAKVEVLGGDIYLNNIAERVDAQTFQGGVTVRNSSGKMSLSTTAGNIVAYNTDSSEIGDYFKAKTRSGAITLQSVGQKEVESSSISGSINYIGLISVNGRYGFSTTNGAINLALPAETSCRIVAAYGGSFQSELPLADITKERTEALVYLKGTMGKGEANLNLKSFNGSITIRERKESVLAEF